MTDWQMAMQLGFREPSAPVLAPIYDRPRPVPVTDAEARTWAKARARGMPWRELSAKFGRPIQTLQNHVARINGFGSPG
jgi:hypothetical protein